MSKPVLRLGPLPKTETVKLTVTLGVALKAELDRYAELHSQTWGESVDAATLIPHMLETFITRDRGYRKASTAQGDLGHGPRAIQEAGERS